MTKFLPFLLPAILLFCAPSLTAAATYDHSQADQVAKQRLKTLQQLAASDPKSVADYSVKSAQDLKHAALGSPFPVYFLHVELLSHYTPDENPKDFLYGLHFIYPVTIDGNIVTSMKITQGSDGHWRLDTLENSPKMIAGILKAASVLSTVHKPADTFAIEDGGEIVFVGVFQGDDIALLPFNDESHLGLKTDVRVSARNLFVKFREEAQKVTREQPDFK
ncbi:MAG TPA: hypothetical protein VI685_10565 [Candidatus Angelobacter sp.]